MSEIELLQNILIGVSALGIVNCLSSVFNGFIAVMLMSDRMRGK